jgi:ribosomal protein L11 methyltransferase
MLFDVPRDRAESLAEALEAAGALAVALEDAQDVPLYEPAPGSITLWPITRLKALFEECVQPRDVLSALESSLEACPPTPSAVEAVEERDWQRECEARFSPRLFGERLWVGPSWHRPPGDRAEYVVLDPGLAFGTGGHPTTALCLEWLTRQSLAETTVVDYGCGSGILSVAAARLGALQVWGVDHDPQARQATSRNAWLNDLGNRVCVVSPEDLPGVKRDFVVANILAAPLVELAGRLAGLLGPGGRMALSGILEEQARQVREAYEPWVRFGEARVQEGWTLLSGMRR